MNFIKRRLVRACFGMQITPDTIAPSHRSAAARGAGEVALQTERLKYLKCSYNTGSLWPAVRVILFNHAIYSLSSQRWRNRQGFGSKFTQAYYTHRWYALVRMTWQLSKNHLATKQRKCRTMQEVLDLYIVHVLKDTSIQGQFQQLQWYHSRYTYIQRFHCSCNCSASSQ